MAADDKELDPFFNNLEDVVGDKAAGGQTAELSKSSYGSLMVRQRRPRYGSMVLAFLIVVGLLYFWITPPTKKTAQNKEFTAPTRDKIIIHQNEKVLPLDNAPTRKFELDQGDLNKGEYYIKVADCTFMICIENTEAALRETQIPSVQKQSAQSFQFVELASRKLYNQEELSTILPKLSSLKSLNVYPSLNNGKNGQRIVLGLFSTLQEAKNVYAAVNQLGFEQETPAFAYNWVKRTQKVTKVYAGPFLNKETADRIFKEIYNLTSLEPQTVERIAQAQAILPKPPVEDIEVTVESMP